MPAMLSLSLLLLTVAALLGAGLAVVALGGRRVPAPAGLVHGALALAGWALLLAALRGPPRGAATGTESFGAVAAVLLALALLVGVGILALRRRRRPGGALIGVHATLAVSGVVVLAAYVALG